MATTQYIIDKNQPFKGSVINTITKPPYVDYTEGKKWEDYKEEEEKKGENINLVIINAQEIDKLLKEYHSGLITEWEEVTEEKYYYGLECMPPLKWHNLQSGINIFYICEAYTSDIHTAYIKATNKDEIKYYSASRRLRETDAELLESILKVLNK